MIFVSALSRAYDRDQAKPHHRKPAEAGSSSGALAAQP
jgi:hypothetical protein